MKYPFKKCKSCEYCKKIKYGTKLRWAYFCMFDHDLKGVPINASNAACEKYEDGEVESDEALLD